jgi:hypothetical protein
MISDPREHPCHELACRIIIDRISLHRFCAGALRTDTRVANEPLQKRRGRVTTLASAHAMSSSASSLSGRR